MQIWHIYFAHHLMNGDGVYFRWRPKIFRWSIALSLMFIYTIGLAFRLNEHHLIRTLLPFYENDDPRMGFVYVCNHLWTVNNHSFNSIVINNIHIQHLFGKLKILKQIKIPSHFRLWHICKQRLSCRNEKLRKNQHVIIFWFSIRFLTQPWAV